MDEGELLAGKALTGIVHPPICKGGRLSHRPLRTVAPSTILADLYHWADTDTQGR